MTSRQIRQILIPIVRSLREHYNPQKIVLFGSYAYGNPNPDSDLDLLIIKETSDRFIDRWRSVRKILSDSRRNIPVETLILTPEEIRDRLENGDPFISEIINLGRVIYEDKQDTGFKLPA